MADGSAARLCIYFTDFFDVTPGALEEHGAFNVSLVNDLPLFIDPFLLFDSEDEQFVALHEDIIRYVKFLRDVSLENELRPGMIDHWFRFPEVKQNWLGFSRKGKGGTGLGSDFAETLHRNLGQIFKAFGTETVTRGSHLEKLCLLSDSVGRDHLSDFTTNLVKGYLLDYTQSFARSHLRPERRGAFAVDRVRFDYESRRWKGAHYDLPANGRDFVILTPKAMLTKDEAWINRSDLINRFEDVYAALPDQQLRAQVDDYFMRRLSAEATKKEVRAAASETVEKISRDSRLLHQGKGRERRRGAPG
ncbi:MAG TPA: hypothetical protein VG937_00370 [Polyangiaceae bacterium]|nr:hypothetical protein [Polyangiaceae bacterium]